MRILLYRSGALGDTLLTLPALDALRHRHPLASLTLAAHPAYGAPLLGAGRIDTLIDAGAPPFHLLHAAPADDDLDRLLRAFNLIIILARDPEGSAAARLGPLGAQPLIVPPFPPKGDRRHIAAWTLAAIKAKISISPSGPALLAPDPFIQTKQIQSDAEQTLNHLGIFSKPFIAIHPGGGGRPKWPSPGPLAALARGFCTKTGARPLLIEGPADEVPISEFRTAWGDLKATRGEPAPTGAGNEIPILSSLPLDLLSALLARSLAYIGGDSGVSHLAALSGAPTLALFGPDSDPERWAPLNPRAEGSGPRAGWISWDRMGEGVDVLMRLAGGRP